MKNLLLSTRENSEFYENKFPFPKQGICNNLPIKAGMTVKEIANVTSDRMMTYVERALKSAGFLTETIRNSNK